MKLSQAGLEQIEKNEGFAETMYPDHKGYSIGYGHLLSKEQQLMFTGKKISKELAEVLLNQDVSFAEGAVTHSVTVPLTQDQFDALVDFTYNVGPVALGKVADTLNTGNYKGAGARIQLYDKVRVNGKLMVNPGLTARRNQEAKWFLEDERIYVGKL